MTRVTPSTLQHRRVVLAYRVSAGIHVTLVWFADTKLSAVNVWDSLADERFELVVSPDVSPIDVYEHPYAYAAWRGLDPASDRLPRAA